MKKFEITKRLLITVGIFGVVFMGTMFSMPGVSFSDVENTLLSYLLNMASGGNITRMGWFALGISPFITASIIIQLLSKGVVPHLYRLSKQGEKGRKALNKYTKVLTVIFASILAYLSIYNPSYYAQLGYTPMFDHRTALFIGLVTGSLVMTYLGDLINEYGIGNGQSLLIAFGILLHSVFDVYAVYTTTLVALEAGIKQPMYQALFLLFGALVITILLSIWGNKKEWDFPLKSKVLSTLVKDHYFSVKLLASSVMPIILTSSVFATVITCGILFKFDTGWLNYTTNWTAFGIFAGLIFVFTFIYNYIQTDGDELAKNLRESSTYLVGVPEQETAKFIDKKVFKISCLGAPTLTLIAVLLILAGMAAPMRIPTTLSGGSILIVVFAVIELFHHIKGIRVKNEELKFVGGKK